jgi:serine/threonine kinase 16
LKKIRCPFGEESVSQALKEVEAYTLFTSCNNIIRSIDHSVASDRSDPGAKTVYIVLPYYRRGNLQDAINANLVNHTKFPEKKLMTLFLGVCKALKAMHQHRIKTSGARANDAARARQVREEAAEADEEARTEARGKGKKKKMRMEANAAEDDEEEAAPLMDDEVTRGQEAVPTGDISAYAHRDIKPGKSCLRPISTTSSY